jgi:hypothetical protein
MYGFRWALSSKSPPARHVYARVGSRGWLAGLPRSAMGSRPLTLRRLVSRPPRPTRVYEPASSSPSAFGRRYSGVVGVVGVLGVCLACSTSPGGQGDRASGAEDAKDAKVKDDAAIARIQAAESRLAVIQPGLPGSTEAAASFMMRLAAYVSTRLSADAAAPRGAARVSLEATYFNEPDLARAELRKRPVATAIVSVGFYLEERRRFGLVPILELLPEGSYHLLVPALGAADAASLRGASAVGGIFYEPRFFERIAFRDVEGRETWKGQATVNVATALRQLRRGRFAAIVLGHRDHTTLSELGQLADLRQIAESEAFPSALLVSVRSPEGDGVEPVDGAPTTKDDAPETPENRPEASPASPTADSAPAPTVEANPDGPNRSGETESKETASKETAEESGGSIRRALSPREESWARVFQGMAEEKEGKSLLEDMGSVGCRPVRQEWLQKLERKHDEKPSE